MSIHVTDEISPLETVVVGIANTDNFHELPEIFYDPISLDTARKKQLPTTALLNEALDLLCQTLTKQGVKVLRPSQGIGYNQIFVRDIGFVIDNYFFRSNILPHRGCELESINLLMRQVGNQKIIELPEHIHAEGGDIILTKSHNFIGTYEGEDYPDMITARTNKFIIPFLSELMPHRTTKCFNLIKSATDLHKNVLHLDCCFQPVGTQYAILYPEGFSDQKDVAWLKNYFGAKNIFTLTHDEGCILTSNIFSITPNLVISDQRFVRLNKWLNDKKIKVIELPFKEIGKLGGLFRCATLPLKRKRT